MADRPPLTAALRQAAALAGPGATVRHTGALAGGTHARTLPVQTAARRLAAPADPGR